MRKTYRAIKYWLQDYNRGKVIALSVTVVACSTMIWHNNWVMYQDLKRDHHRAVVIYNSIEERRAGAVESLNSVEASKEATPVSSGEQTMDTPRENRTVEEIIEETSRQHGFTNTELLKKIAICESSLDPEKPCSDPKSTSLGLYQFNEGTWNDGIKATGNYDWTLEDRKDPEKATRMAIYFIAKGELMRRWEASANCWAS